MIRKNQKGFTLVELIIAVAILAIVTLAVCGFIVVGSKSYTSANTDIMLQQEAQLALNQISDVIIDTTDSITYSVGTGSGLQNVLKDSEYGGEATDKCLVVINRTDTNSNNLNPSYWFYWNKDLETIYFNELPTVKPSMSYDEIQAELANADSGRAILAEHVTDLNIDISQFEENRVVMISMTLQNGNREYSTSNNVTVRNRIALNVVDIDPMQRADDFLISNVASVVLEPGDEYTFRPDVDTSSSDEALVWKPLGDLGSGTTASQSGNDCTVRVGLDEERRTFALRVERENEQYAGQNNRVGITVYVEVKRVNSVNLEAEGSVTTVEPGSTIKITGAASGWHLGDRDNSDSCQTVDITKDYDLEEWGRADGSADFTVLSSNASGATIKIGDTVTEGQTIIVEATSSLSKKKGYALGSDTNPSKPGIQGILRLRVEGGIKNTVQLPDDGFRFGTDNDDRAKMTYNFITSNSGMTPFSKGYLVCVRVREMGASTCENDQIMVYTCGGENVRFAPDMFGLELDRDYQLFMQLLIPVKKSAYAPGAADSAVVGSPDNAADHGYKDDYREVALHYVANVDSYGEYNGDVYEASPLFSGLISPPRISVNVDHKTEFPNDDDTYISCNLSADQGKFIIDSIYFGQTNNIREDMALDKGNVKFSIYTEGGNDYNGWKLVGGYNPSVNSGKDSDNGYISSFADGVFTVASKMSGNPLLAGSNYMKVENNLSSSQLQNAAGTYYIVPGFWYRNLTIGELTSVTYTVYYEQNVRNDHTWHYYHQPNSKIPLKAEAGYGLNLQLPNENNETRWTHFPVPSDSEFPFERKGDGLQTITWPKNSWEQIKKYSSSGEDKGTWKNSVKIDCEYDSATDTYTIWLYDEIGRNGASYKRRVYGQYTCKTNGSEWAVKDLVEHEDQVTIKTNIEYTKNGKNWAAYFPTPGVSGFPFNNVTSSKAQTIEKYSLVSYDKGDNYKRDTQIMTAECSMSGSDFVLTLKDETINGSGHQKTITIYGVWQCTASGATWDYIANSAGTRYEYIWDTTVKFTYNGNQCMIELPLPGSAGFPKFSGTYEVSVPEYYYQSDLAGANPQNSNGGLKLKYTDNGGGSYTVQLVNGYYTPQVYYTWTYSGSGDSWTLVQ